MDVTKPIWEGGTSPKGRHKSKGEVQARTSGRHTHHEPETIPSGNEERKHKRHQLEGGKRRQSRSKRETSKRQASNQQATSKKQARNKQQATASTNKQHKASNLQQQTINSKET
jgi:hypothetical protein